MLGAFLLGGPRSARNRNLFVDLPARVSPAGAFLSLIYSIAMGDSKGRAKVSGLTWPWPSTDSSSLNPYPKEVVNNLKRFDNHYVPMLDESSQDILAPDILMIGDIESVSVPSRATSIFYSTQGAVSDKEEKIRSATLQLVSDARSDIVFTDKVWSHLRIDSGMLPGSCIQVCTAGPSVAVALAGVEKDLYTYLMAKDGNVYFVWSTTSIPTIEDVFLWPVGNMVAQDSFAVGLNLMALRNRWFRNCLPPPPGAGAVDSARLAKSIALFHRWLCKHTRNNPQ